MKDKNISDRELLTLLSIAIDIAVSAHSGQFDKAGVPYILHPLRVMGGVKTVSEKIVGVLHDVVEDTDITLDDLLNKYKFPQYIVDAVDSVTARENESYNSFIQRVKLNKIGRKVKIVDLRDNSDLFRLHDIEEKHLSLMKRYHNAMKILRKDGKVYITK